MSIIDSTAEIIGSGNKYIAEQGNTVLICSEFIIVPCISIIIITGILCFTYYKVKMIGGKR